MKMGLYAVQNPGEVACEYLPSGHTVRRELEEREFKKEYAKKFRYVMEELRWVNDLN